MTTATAGPLLFRQRGGHQQSQAWDCSLLLVHVLESLVASNGSVRCSVGTANDAPPAPSVFQNGTACEITAADAAATSTETATVNKDAAAAWADTTVLELGCGK